MGSSRRDLGSYPGMIIFQKENSPVLQGLCSGSAKTKAKTKQARTKSQEPSSSFICSTNTFWYVPCSRPVASVGINWWTRQMFLVCRAQTPMGEGWWTRNKCKIKYVMGTALEWWKESGDLFTGAITLFGGIVRKGKIQGIRIRIITIMTNTDGGLTMCYFQVSKRYHHHPPLAQEAETEVVICPHLLGQWVSALRRLKPTSQTSHCMAYRRHRLPHAVEGVGTQVALSMLQNSTLTPNQEPHHNASQLQTCEKSSPLKM